MRCGWAQPPRRWLNDGVSGVALRFLDILTTASAVASYLAAPDVAAPHMLDALDILEGHARLEELGRARSVLAPMPPSAYGGVEPAIRELVQRWFEQLGQDPEGLLDADQVQALRAQLQALRDAPPPER